MSATNRLDVLVVDDDAAIRRQLRGVLEDEGHLVTEAGDAEQALELLEARRMDVVLLDIHLPGESGLDALVKIRELAPDTGVIMVSGESTLANAMRAGQRGAYDFIEKPPDPERLLAVLQEAARVTRVRRAPAPAEAPGDLGMLGDSPPIRALRDGIRRIAPSQGRVLILGENGSGKELAAEAIHALSKRAAGPFVKLNCAAIPKDLVESELFGYERGAFTGAMQSKKGRIELADGGTLFLDEIGDLSLEAQAKLLRAIETGEIERVGGTRTARVDVRTIAATHKDLAGAIESGAFRQDLFYRLNVLPLQVPALRERRGDIVPLAAHFLAACCAAEGKPVKRLRPEAGALLEEYHWPGNVRELRNLMERAAILVEGAEVGTGDLTAWLESPLAREEAVGLRGEIERREADAVRRALDAANGNVTQAAAALGIDRTNLHRKIRKYGIQKP
ncbi:MAG: sigma-54-dependent Fis family transcriptional regulator [Candidatus Eisenbacteria bacterium]|uniref:Sigma-54-dependent Fis family transcriptional regulator n=1 Tax=Eiseniibacteriota bacterium TaxID=2212470 RepID=A0A9D6QJW2_UNCEI|nr:sigma-54-dependent Fis family transcriptional regulator [Candidatus Eisenbacteria bacterium]